MTDARKAGRELDALVAEKVMGLPRTKRVIVDTETGPKDMGWLPAEIPHYSTDVAAAWEVVEALRLRDFEFNMYCYANGNRAAFWKSPNEDSGRRGAADTAPLAICLAALKAVEP